MCLRFVLLIILLEQSITLQDIKNYILAILIIASLIFVARVVIVIYRLLRSSASVEEAEADATE
jgi:hypothetical protein